jgi:hypothetical protein
MKKLFYYEGELFAYTDTKLPVRECQTFPCLIRYTTERLHWEDHLNSIVYDDVVFYAPHAGAVYDSKYLDAFAYEVFAVAYTKKVLYSDAYIIPEFTFFSRRKPMISKVIPDVFCVSANGKDGRVIDIHGKEVWVRKDADGLWAAYDEPPFSEKTAGALLTAFDKNVVVFYDDEYQNSSNIWYRCIDSCHCFYGYFKAHTSIDPDNLPENNVCIIHIAQIEDDPHHGLLREWLHFYSRLLYCRRNV